MKTFYTESDIGCVKIGIESKCTFFISNGYGGGIITVLVYDKDEEEFSNYPLSGQVEGAEINIYDYDCDGGEVVTTISGKYFIYILDDREKILNEGAVAFVKFAD